MGGFRDFRVPVSVRQVISEPSYSYIRDIAVVCKGIVGQTEPAVVELYDKDSIADFTQSSEVEKLFQGGVGRVILITLNPEATDLTTAKPLVDELKGKALTVMVADSMSYSSSDIKDNCKIPTPNSVIIAAFPEAQIGEASLLAMSEEAYICNDGISQAMYKTAKTLSHSNITNNQGMEYPYPIGVGTVTDDGKALAYYNQNLSFFFEDSEVGVKLGFSQCGGESFTHRYISEQVNLSTQQAINAYIDEQQPNNSEDTRIDLQIRSDSVLRAYGETGAIDYEKSGVVVTEMPDRKYESKVTVRTEQATPLWRVPLEIIQA